MADRPVVFLLRRGCRVGLRSLLGFSALAAAASACAQVLEPEQEPVIQPEVERREIEPPRINVDDLELGLSFGLLSVDQFGTNVLAGLRVAYHVTADVFIELGLAASTVSDERYRRFGLPLFADEDEPLLRYDLSAAFSFLPGEAFLGTARAMPSTFYVIGGVGVTDFAEQEHFTFNLGLGMRLLPGQRIALRVEMRDHVFESDFLGENDLTHNLELTGTLSYLF